MYNTLVNIILILNTMRILPLLCYIISMLLTATCCFLYRHRPVLGECLSSFAGCFPVAFLEPGMNKYNKYSILFGLEGKISEHSLEAQGKLGLVVRKPVFGVSDRV